MKVRFVLPFIFGLLGVLTIIVSTIIDINNPKNVYITWTASLFIVAEICIIRFYSLDISGFSQSIIASDPANSDLNPITFVNWMTIAQIIGLFATVIIHYNFIIGMLTYLLMHLSLIKSFSGIFPLKFSVINRSTFTQLKKITKLSIIFWTGTVVLVYSTLIYGGIDSLVVVPYVIAIGIMAHYTWYGVVYSKRSVLFRWFPIIASALFFFSDSIIGSSVFGPFKVNNALILIIDLTYVFNLFLMSSAILFQGPFKE